MGSRSFAGFALCLAAMGCTVGGEDALYECHAEETELGGDAQPGPELGFAADDVLDWALGAREADVRFLGPPAGVRANYELHDSRVQFELSRGSGAAREVKDDRACGESTELRIPAQLAITTSDGALDESVRATLVARRKEFAYLAAELDLEQLSGGLKFELEDPELRFLRSGVSIVLTPYGSAGQLGTALERRNAQASTAYPSGALLAWPAGSACGTSSVTQPLEEDDADWVQPLADVRMASWTAAESAEAPRSALVAIDPGGVVCESEDGSLSAPFDVRLQMDDGGEELQLPARLQRTEDDGLELALDGSARASDRPPAFVERFGDFGLDLDGYSAVMLELKLVLGAETVSGRFAVVGFEDSCKPVCTASGCSGCPPAVQRTLLELTLEQAR